LLVCDRAADALGGASDEVMGDERRQSGIYLAGSASAAPTVTIHVHTSTSRLQAQSQHHSRGTAAAISLKFRERVFAGINDQNLTRIIHN
jgi:hypothetical protein